MEIENLKALDAIMENAGLIGGKRHRTVKKAVPKKKSKGSKKTIKKLSKKPSRKVKKTSRTKKKK